MQKICLLLLLLISACTIPPDTSSILDKSSCTLPCWNDIVAGQTTEDNLLQILEHLPDVDQESIQNANQAWRIFDNQIFFSFHQSWTLSQRPKLRGYAYTTNSVLSELIICGDTKTSIGAIAKQVGEPENIISGDNVTGDRTVILINSQKGLAYWYSTDPKLNEMQYEIGPETKVGCLDLFDPDLYQEMLEAKAFSNGYYNAEETLRVMYPWDGYGNLDEKYPPRQP